MFPLPASAAVTPMLPFLLPAVRRPAVTRARRFPVARPPVIASAGPVPITAEPDEANTWRHAKDLLARRRRRDQDRFIRVIGCRCHQASAQGDEAA